MQHKFSDRWPIRVDVEDAVTTENDAWFWLYTKALELGICQSKLFTSYTNRSFGFNDKTVAMEFKLRFG